MRQIRDRFTTLEDGDGLQMRMHLGGHVDGEPGELLGSAGMAAGGGGHGCSGPRANGQKAPALISRQRNLGKEGLAAWRALYGETGKPPGEATPRQVLPQADTPDGPWQTSESVTSGGLASQEPTEGVHVSRAGVASHADLHLVKGDRRDLDLPGNPARFATSTPQTADQSLGFGWGEIGSHDLILTKVRNKAQAYVGSEPLTLVSTLRGMETLAERLTWALDNQPGPEKHTREDIEAMGIVSTVSIWKVTSGKAQTENPRWLAKIAPVLKVNFFWLLTGKGDVRPVEVKGMQVHNVSESLADIRFDGEEDPVPRTELQSDANRLIVPIRWIPVVGRAKGGPDDSYFEERFEPGDRYGDVQYPAPCPDAYSLIIKGDSMEPRYRHGEFVVVYPHVPPEVGDDVFVRFKDGRKMCKRIASLDNEWVRLESVNPAYRPLTVELVDLEPEGGLELIAGPVPRRLFKAYEPHMDQR